MARRTKITLGMLESDPNPHVSPNLSQKHVGMIVRQLEAAGFDRDAVRRDLNAR